LTNDYSGVYQLDAVKYTVTPTETERPDTATLSAPSTFSASRTLKAVNDRTVRFFHETNAELRSGYASNEEYWTGLRKFGITFSRNDDGSFRTGAWIPYEPTDAVKSVNIVSDNCAYSDGIFTFQYDYIDGSTRYRIQGTLKK
jgi:hypothetical protein